MKLLCRMVRPSFFISLIFMLSVGSSLFTKLCLSFFAVIFVSEFAAIKC